MKFNKAVLCGIILLAYTGCVSMVEKTGRVLDGSAFAEKKLAMYKNEEAEVTLVQNKADERSVLISLNDFPMLKIRGCAPDENGEFFLTSLEYLGGNVHGWNEYSMEVTGEASLVLSDASGAVLLIKSEIEKVEITDGRIHRYDSRITGSEALTGLRNRRERITAAVDWMASIEGSPRGQNIENFENHWRPVLFPEMVSKKKRPAGWMQKGDVLVKADDIRWNTGYSERVFPKELIPVRNSGTLYRDWEEAVLWIYYEYEWENIKEKLSREIFLQQKK